MTAHNHTIGGKGKRARDLPPKVRQVIVTCVCGQAHTFTVTERDLLCIHICHGCQSVVRWYRDAGATSEVVE